MVNILIVDDQKWVEDLCSKALAAESYSITVTSDIESVMKNVANFNPDLVLLNLYLKHGFNGWDVLLDIKTQDPNLPVFMITAHEKCLYDPRLSNANGYIIDGSLASEDMKKKIAQVLNQEPGAC
jgi:DNA-binding NtrC family response regulator